MAALLLLFPDNSLGSVGSLGEELPSFVVSLAFGVVWLTPGILGNDWLSSGILGDSSL